MSSHFYSPATTEVNVDRQIREARSVESEGRKAIVHSHGVGEKCTAVDCRFFGYTDDEIKEWADENAGD